MLTALLLACLLLLAASAWAQAPEPQQEPEEEEETEADPEEGGEPDEDPQGQDAEGDEGSASGQVSGEEAEDRTDQQAEAQAPPAPVPDWVVPGVQITYELTFWEDTAADGVRGTETWTVVSVEQGVGVFTATTDLPVEAFPHAGTYEVDLDTRRVLSGPEPVYTDQSFWLWAPETPVGGSARIHALTIPSVPPEDPSLVQFVGETTVAPEGKGEHPMHVELAYGDSGAMLANAIYVVGNVRADRYLLSASHPDASTEETATQMDTTSGAPSSGTWKGTAVLVGLVAIAGIALWRKGGVRVTTEVNGRVGERARVSRDSSPVPSDVGTASPSSRFCGACGAASVGDGAFCHACGTAMAEE